MVPNVEQDSVQDFESMVSEQDFGSAKNEEVQKKTVRPKIFSKPSEDVEVVVTAYYDKDTGEFAFALPNRVEKGEESSASENFIVMEHIFVFSNVPYNRLNIYKTRSGKYNEADRTTSLDFIKLRDFLWTFHLKSWNLEDEDGEIIPLTHDKDGTLSDESSAMLWQITPALLDMVIKVFEDKIHLFG